MRGFILDHSFPAADLRGQLAAWDGELHVPVSELKEAESAENPLSKLLDLRAYEVPGKVRDWLAGSEGRVAGPADLAGSEDAADGGGVLGAIMKFGGDIPVVDIAAGVAGTGLGTAIAVSHGQPVLPALTEQTVSNAASIGAGA
jgi:hypothetical protein